MEGWAWHDARRPPLGIPPRSVPPEGHQSLLGAEAQRRHTTAYFLNYQSIITSIYLLSRASRRSQADSHTPGLHLQLKPEVLHCPPSLPSSPPDRLISSGWSVRRVRVALQVLGQAWGAVWGPAWGAADLSCGAVVLVRPRDCCKPPHQLTLSLFANPSPRPSPPGGWDDGSCGVPAPGRLPRGRRLPRHRLGAHHRRAGAVGAVAGRRQRQPLGHRAQARRWGKGRDVGGEGRGQDFPGRGWACRIWYGGG